MTLSDAIAAYNLLASAHLTQMAAEDKFVVVKACRALRPFALDFDEMRADTIIRLRGDEHDRLAAIAEQRLPADPAELRAAQAYMHDYGESVARCLTQELDRLAPIALPRLGEAAFEALVASNDYDVKTIILLQDLLTDVS